MRVSNPLDYKVEQIYSLRRLLNGLLRHLETAVGVMTIIEMLQPTPRVLHTLNGMWKISTKVPWWAEWESNPHIISDTGF